MAKYQLDYGALNEIADELMFMDDDMKSSIKEVAKEIGNELKTNTQAAIPRSKGKAKHGVHLASDVKLSVSANNKRATIAVKGGKQTAKYWWPVDSGHVAENGTWVPGANFTDLAYQMTNVEAPLNSLIDRLVK